MAIEFWHTFLLTFGLIVATVISSELFQQLENYNGDSPETEAFISNVLRHRKELRWIEDLSRKYPARKNERNLRKFIKNKRNEEYDEDYSQFDPYNIEWEPQWTDQFEKTKRAVSNNRPFTVRTNGLNNLLKSHGLKNKKSKRFPFQLKLPEHSVPTKHDKDLSKFRNGEHNILGLKDFSAKNEMMEEMKKIHYKRVKEIDNKPNKQTRIKREQLEHSNLKPVIVVQGQTGLRKPICVSDPCDVEQSEKLDLLEALQEDTETSTSPLPSVIIFIPTSSNIIPKKVISPKKFQVLDMESEDIIPESNIYQELVQSSVQENPPKENFVQQLTIQDHPDNELTSDEKKQAVQEAKMILGINNKLNEQKDPENLDKSCSEEFELKDKDKPNYGTNLIAESKQKQGIKVKNNNDNFQGVSVEDENKLISQINDETKTINKRNSLKQRKILKVEPINKIIRTKKENSYYKNAKVTTMDESDQQSEQLPNALENRRKYRSRRLLNYESLDEVKKHVVPRSDYKNDQEENFSPGKTIKKLKDFFGFGNENNYNDDVTEVSTEDYDYVEPTKPHKEHRPRMKLKQKLKHYKYQDRIKFARHERSETTTNSEDLESKTEILIADYEEEEEENCTEPVTDILKAKEEEHKMDMDTTEATESHHMTTTHIVATEHTNADEDLCLTTTEPTTTTHATTTEHHEKHRENSTVSPNKTQEAPDVLTVDQALAEKNKGHNNSEEISLKETTTPNEECLDENIAKIATEHSTKKPLNLCSGAKYLKKYKHKKIKRYHKNKPQKQIKYFPEFSRTLHQKRNQNFEKSILKLPKRIFTFPRDRPSHRIRRSNLFQKPDKTKTNHFFHKEQNFQSPKITENKKFETCDSCVGNTEYNGTDPQIKDNVLQGELAKSILEKIYKLVSESPEFQRHIEQGLAKTTEWPNERLINCKEKKVNHKQMEEIMNKLIIDVNKIIEEKLAEENCIHLDPISAKFLKWLTRGQEKQGLQPSEDETVSKNEDPFLFPRPGSENCETELTSQGAHKVDKEHELEKETQAPETYHYEDVNTAPTGEQSEHKTGYEVTEEEHPEHKTQTTSYEVPAEEHPEHKTQTTEYEVPAEEHHEHKTQAVYTTEHVVHTTEHVVHTTEHVVHTTEHITHAPEHETHEEKHTTEIPEHTTETPEHTTETPEHTTETIQSEDVHTTQRVRTFRDKKYDFENDEQTIQNLKQVQYQVEKMMNLYHRLPEEDKAQFSNLYKYLHEQHIILDRILHELETKNMNVNNQDWYPKSRGFAPNKWRAHYLRKLPMIEQDDEDEENYDNENQGDFYYDNN